jgi:hypothetical protein
MTVNGTIVHPVPLNRPRRFTSHRRLVAGRGRPRWHRRPPVVRLSRRSTFRPAPSGRVRRPCLGVCVLMIDARPLLPSIGVVALGLALDCEIDVMGFLTTRYFGLRRVAELYGHLFAVFSASSAVGPFLMGLSFDLCHSYVPGRASNGKLAGLPPEPRRLSCSDAMHPDKRIRRSPTMSRSTMATAWSTAMPKDRTLLSAAARVHRPARRRGSGMIE